MTDNIKLPPIQDGIFCAPGPIWGHILDWGSAEPGPAAGEHADAIDAAITRVMHDHAREAVRLNATVPDEPDWRHPKIQGLIGSEARLRIAIDLIWQILEDPNQEFTASDMEYWDTIHDDLKAALSAAPAAPQPARTALKQYDLEQSEDYRKGYDDGRKKGYEVGYRQATEHAAMKSQPTSGWTPTTEKSKNEE